MAFVAAVSLFLCFFLPRALQDHPQFITDIEALLGRATSSSERNDIIREIEKSIIFNIKPKWEASSGSGFGNGEEFGSQNVFMFTGRSTSDVIEEASELETGLVIGGYVAMLAYSILVFTNYRNAIYSHGVVAGLSVLVIALATSASLGLTAWFKIKFTPISSNVCCCICLSSIRR